MAPYVSSRLEWRRAYVVRRQRPGTPACRSDTATTNKLHAR